MIQMTRNAALGCRLMLIVLGLATAACGMDMSEPDPPSDLTVMEVSGGAHLKWKDNSDNEGSFMLERKVGTGSFTQYKTLDFNTTEYHDAGLEAGLTYTYRIMAMPKSGGHASGSTKYSNEVTFTLGS